MDLPEVHLRHKLPIVDVWKGLAFAADSPPRRATASRARPRPGSGENGALVGVRITTRELRSLAPREPLQPRHLGERRDVFLPRLHARVEIGVVRVHSLLNPFHPALEPLPLAKQAPADGSTVGDPTLALSARDSYSSRREFELASQASIETTHASVEGLDPCTRAARTRARARRADPRAVRLEHRVVSFLERIERGGETRPTLAAPDDGRHRSLAVVSSPARATRARDAKCSELDASMTCLATCSARRSRWTSPRSTRGRRIGSVGGEVLRSRSRWTS